MRLYNQICVLFERESRKGYMNRVIAYHHYAKQAARWRVSLATIYNAYSMLETKGLFAPNRSQAVLYRDDIRPVCPRRYRFAASPAGS